MLMLWQPHGQHVGDNSPKHNKNKFVEQWSVLCMQVRMGRHHASASSPTHLLLLVGDPRACRQYQPLHLGSLGVPRIAHGQCVSGTQAV